MGQALYTQAVLANTPRAYWLMNDYVLPQDSSGNGRHITANSFFTGTRGFPGPFAGARASIGVGGTQMSRAAVSTATDNLTAEFWFKPEIVNANGQPIFTNDAGSNGWSMYIDNDRRFGCVIQGVAFLSLSTAALTLDAWHYIVMTRRATVWSYFINGVVDTANAGTHTLGAAPTLTGIHGAGNLQAWYSNMAIYDTSLSNAEILSHYQAALRSDDQAVRSGLSVSTTA